MSKLPWIILEHPDSAPRGFMIVLLHWVYLPAGIVEDDYYDDEPEAIFGLN